MRSIILLLFAVLPATTTFAAQGIQWNRLAGVTDVETAERQFIEQQAEELLLSGQFEKLEKIATDFRTSKEEFSDGEWKLSVLYDGLSYYLKNASEENWVNRLEKLKQWVQKKPNSVTAHVAMTECLVGYAFFGRTQKWSRDVSENQWKLFYDRMNEAIDVLNEVKGSRENYPEWTAAYQRITFGNWDRGKYETQFKEAISKEPTYNMCYFRKALTLLPWWYGNPGEWEQFARAAADKVGGIEGDILYARIVWFLDSRVPGPILAETPSIDYKRVFKGANEIAKFNFNKRKKNN